MRWPYIVMGVAFSAFGAGAVWAWGDDVVEVANLSVPYKISSSEGSERGVVKYHIFLTRHIHEGGEPSSIFHPADDRQCDWRMEGHMDRVVCMTSLTGVTSCNNSLAKNLPINLSGQSGAPSNWFDHRPCSDFIGQINSQTEQLKSSMNVTALVQADLNGDLKQTLQGGGVTVTYGTVTQ